MPPPKDADAVSDNAEVTNEDREKATDGGSEGGEDGTEEEEYEIEAILDAKRGRFEKVCVKRPNLGEKFVLSRFGRVFFLSGDRSLLAHLQPFKTFFFDVFMH